MNTIEFYKELYNKSTDDGDKISSAIPLNIGMLSILIKLIYDNYTLVYKPLDWFLFVLCCFYVTYSVFYCFKIMIDIKWFSFGVYRYIVHTNPKEWYDYAKTATEDEFKVELTERYVEYAENNFKLNTKRRFYVSRARIGIIISLLIYFSLYIMVH